MKTPHRCAPSSLLSVLLLTVIFSSLYFGLRRLPAAQCGFLHYEVAEVLDDGTEVCATTNHAKFIDLDFYRFPVKLRLEPEGELHPGTSTPFRMALVTDGGRMLLPHELAVTHTERIHLMVVDESLQDYHHIHPQPEGNSGYYSFTFTPARAENYRFFAEIVPVRTRRQIVADAYWSVPGDSADEPVIHLNGAVQVDGYDFHLVSEQSRLRRNRDNPLRLIVSHPDGRPVEMEKVMGAYAHLVAFDDNLRGYAHMHPLTLDSPDPRAPEVPFLFYSPVAGKHRIWAQVQINGREVFAPFDVVVN